METVGFIGLGNMGGPVAGHIQRAGFPMVVFDLRQEVTRPLRERGAKVVDSACELARQSDVIITALPMPKEVEQVSCGENGIIEGIRPGSVTLIYPRVRRRSSANSNPSSAPRGLLCSTLPSPQASRAPPAAFTK
jgi:3-hydroxyisobutyrate dehydrogenase-like beta-hydroxyacid dehydrogenase